MVEASIKFSVLWTRYTFGITIQLVCKTLVCLQRTGCSEMLMANAVAELAIRTPGKESVAMESFAKALRMVSLFNQSTGLM